MPTVMSPGLQSPGLRLRDGSSALRLSFGRGLDRKRNGMEWNGTGNAMDSAMDSDGHRVGYLVDVNDEESDFNRNSPFLHDVWHGMKGYLFQGFVARPKGGVARARERAKFVNDGDSNDRAWDVSQMNASMIGIDHVVKSDDYSSGKVQKQRWIPRVRSENDGSKCEVGSSGSEGSSEKGAAEKDSGNKNEVTGSKFNTISSITNAPHENRAVASTGKLSSPNKSPNVNTPSPNSNPIAMSTTPDDNVRPACLKAPITKHSLSFTTSTSFSVRIERFYRDTTSGLMKKEMRAINLPTEYLVPVGFRENLKAGEDFTVNLQKELLWSKERNREFERFDWDRNEIQLHKAGFAALQNWVEDISGINWRTVVEWDKETEKESDHNRGTDDIKGTDNVKEGTDNRRTDDKGTENRGSDSRGTDDRGTDNRGTDNRGTDNKGTDNRETDKSDSAKQLGVVPSASGKEAQKDRVNKNFNSGAGQNFGITIQEARRRIRGFGPFGRVNDSAEHGEKNEKLSTHPQKSQKSQKGSEFGVAEVGAKLGKLSLGNEENMSDKIQNEGRTRKANQNANGSSSAMTDSRVVMKDLDKKMGKLEIESSASLDEKDIEIALRSPKKENLWDQSGDQSETHSGHNSGNKPDDINDNVIVHQQLQLDESEVSQRSESQFGHQSPNKETVTNTPMRRPEGKKALPLFSKYLYSSFVVHIGPGLGAGHYKAYRRERGRVNYSASRTNTRNHTDHKNTITGDINGREINRMTKDDQENDNHQEDHDDTNPNTSPNPQHRSFAHWVELNDEEVRVVSDEFVRSKLSEAYFVTYVEMENMESELVTEMEYRAWEQGKTVGEVLMGEKEARLDAKIKEIADRKREEENKMYEEDEDLQQFEQEFQRQEVQRQELLQADRKAAAAATIGGFLKQYQKAKTDTVNNGNNQKAKTDDHAVKEEVKEDKYLNVIKNVIKNANHNEERHKNT